MKISIEQFLDTTKVIRMLYGVEIAKSYFEKNLDTFFGDSSLIDLHDLISSDTI